MKRRRHSVRIPRTNTYGESFQWCQQMAYSLHLDNPPYKRPTRDFSKPEYVARSHTWTALQRPRIVSFKDPVEIDKNDETPHSLLVRQLSPQSAPDGDTSSKYVKMTDLITLPPHHANAWGVRTPVKTQRSFTAEKYVTSSSMEHLELRTKSISLETLEKTKQNIPEVKMNNAVAKLPDSVEKATPRAINGHEKIESLSPGSSTSAERDNGGTPRHRRKMSAKDLREILKGKGLGDPKHNKHCIGSELTMTREVTLPDIRDIAKVNLKPSKPSNMAKLKGQAKLDYEMATSRANAFCEMQRNNSNMRTASANWRKLRVHVNTFADDVNTDSENGDDLDEVGRENPKTDEEFLTRIQTWIYDVETASKDAQHRLESIGELTA